jgi:hypothetical protein
VFSAHFLLGADSNLCCRQLKMDRGIFFHHVYRVMQKLGREFREVSPYPLFPLDEYFGGTLRGPRGGAGAIEVAETPLHPITGRKVVPLRAPVQRKRRTPRNPVLLAA